ncbi:hypothetical protein IM880_02225 [Pectobacterium polaris]|uniref:Uncharacterized protein n=1 Tax=Pectobacterium polaris TaxID=2042057 RepID=A0AAW4NV87_9GAMM|nr:hypothetical protein [Pectobacterium polaris]MBW5891015.1 hypothetical protein [Pectobacterium polaris]
MNQKRDVQQVTKPRETIRRSEEYKARLGAASLLLAEKMEEKRRAWDSK